MFHTDLLDIEAWLKLPQKISSLCGCMPVQLAFEFDAIKSR